MSGISCIDSIKLTVTGASIEEIIVFILKITVIKNTKNFRQGKWMAITKQLYSSAYKEVLITWR
jgi:hypothetical protein|tara:strand:+ start:693 stop:884 length:192 start_codon:yes stop_codon:yes gene_type:complete